MIEKTFEFHYVSYKKSSYYISKKSMQWTPGSQVYPNIREQIFGKK